jgi:hypothetical protein
MQNEANFSQFVQWPGNPIERIADPGDTIMRTTLIAIAAVAAMFLHPQASQAYEATLVR